MTVRAPQGHQPLLGRLLPYSCPGLPCSREPGKRETLCNGPPVPGEHGGQNSTDLSALPPPTSIRLLPGASRGEEPWACGRGDVRHPMHGITSQHGLQSPQNCGAAMRALLGTEQVGGHGGLSGALTDLHVHLLAPQLVEEVEHAAGVAAPLGCCHQLHLPAGQSRSLGQCARPCCTVPHCDMLCHIVPCQRSLHTWSWGACAPSTGRRFLNHWYWGGGLPMALHSSASVSPSARRHGCGCRRICSPAMVRQ